MNKKNIAFIFPGQGAQKTGMGLDFYENFDVAKNIFNKIDEILGRKISKICFEGTEEELKQTTNTQSALLAVSIAILETFKSKIDLEPKYLAGHSLGEYGALYQAGVLDLENVFKAIQKRSDLMNEATKNNSGSMSAVLGLDADIIRENLIEGVEIANYNEPKQTVITGFSDKILKMNDILKEKGAKRVIPLAVSGAFHSSLMKGASKKFETFVETLDIKNAVVPVIANVDAKETLSKEDFKVKMPKQICSSVMWTQTILKMLENGVDAFVEIGCGQVLTGLNRKICPENIKTYNINSIESLENTLNSLK